MRKVRKVRRVRAAVTAKAVRRTSARLRPEPRTKGCVCVCTFVGVCVLTRAYAG